MVKINQNNYKRKVINTFKLVKGQYRKKFKTDSNLSTDAVPYSGLFEAFIFREFRESKPILENKIIKCGGGAVQYLHS